MSSASAFQPLQCAIIGAGLGGLCAAIALRRQGHNVMIYEQSDFAGEIGAGIGIVSNGTYFLEKQWKIDLSKAKPVVVKKFIRHDWKTGEVLGVTPAGDYKAKFGTHYYGAYRLDLHKALLDEALQEYAEGPPCGLLTKHRLVEVDVDTGFCKFKNGETAQVDLVVGADGIHSEARAALDINLEPEPSPSCCYRMIISCAKLENIGLGHLVKAVKDGVLQFWGGMGIDRIVAGPAKDGEILCCYALYPAAKNDLREDGWNISATPQQLLDTFPDLDPEVRKIFLHAEDIKQWRLYVHPEYPYWHKGRVCLLGDAAHPMMPDQNQGFSQAVEDAGALGLIFSPIYTHIIGQDVELGLSLYEQVRKERATTVQAASLRARTDMRERFGWKTGDDEPGKLTLEWLCDYDMVEHVMNVMAQVVDLKEAEKGAKMETDIFEMEERATQGVLY